MSVKWKEDPADHTYGAAQEYLELGMPDHTAKKLTLQLVDVEKSQFKAKDLLRASALPLLPVDNPGVDKHLTSIAEDSALSPVLLVRGIFHSGVPLIVADGYHRICACYWHDENTYVHCFIASLW
jgi:hypothetical protein